MTPHERHLHIGTRPTGTTLRSTDPQNPKIWRIHSPNSPTSDALNLARAKDAAITWTNPRGLSGSQHAQWHRREITLPASAVA
jgi:hypothetical protein